MRPEETCRVQEAQDRLRSGPRGKTIATPLTSASIASPWLPAGKVNVMARPKIEGYAWRITSFSMVWTTSASARNIVVSDQSRTETLILRPPVENPSDSILVKGQGPAIQETLTFWNSWPSPASSDIEPIAAFHLPSGEQGDRPSQGTLPVLTTSNVFAVLPIVIVVVALTAYRTRIFEI